MRITVLLLGLLGLLGCQSGTHEVFAVALSSQPLAATRGRPQPWPRHDESALAPRASASGAVDVNHAGLAELERVSGIDAERAAAIVAGRPYRSKRELLSRGILTTAEYARWRSLLVAHGGKAGRRPPRRAT